MQIQHFRVQLLPVMPERTETETPPPISVELGQRFRPFEGLQPLRLPKDYETFVENVDYVASREFEFNGVRATIALTLDEDYYSPDVRRDFDTPLGIVKLEHHYEDGGQVTVKTPLQLTIFSTISSIEDYKTLSQYRVVFNIGGNNYYLDCMEQLDKDKSKALEWAEDNIENGIRNNSGGGAFVSNTLLDLSGEEVVAVLPYEPSLLSTIEARIVRKF